MPIRNGGDVAKKRRKKEVHTATSDRLDANEGQTRERSTRLHLAEPGDTTIAVVATTATAVARNLREKY